MVAAEHSSFVPFTRRGAGGDPTAGHHSTAGLCTALWLLT